MSQSQSINLLCVHIFVYMCVYVKDRPRGWWEKTRSITEIEQHMKRQTCWPLPPLSSPNPHSISFTPLVITFITPLLMFFVSPPRIFCIFLLSSSSPCLSLLKHPPSSCCHGHLLFLPSTSSPLYPLFLSRLFPHALSLHPSSSILSILTPLLVMSPLISSCALYFLLVAMVTPLPAQLPWKCKSHHPASLHIICHLSFHLSSSNYPSLLSSLFSSLLLSSQSASTSFTMPLTSHSLLHPPINPLNSPLLSSLLPQLFFLPFL